MPLKTTTTAIFMMSAAIGVSSSAQAQDTYIRPATEDEMTRFCGKPGEIGYAILGVDLSRSQPFDFLSCAFREVKQTDCKKIGRLLDLPDHFRYLTKMPPSAEDQKEDLRTEMRLAPAHLKYCGLVG